MSVSVHTNDCQRPTSVTSNIINVCMCVVRVLVEAGVQEDLLGNQETRSEVISALQHTQKQTTNELKCLYYISSAEVIHYDNESIPMDTVHIVEITVKSQTVSVLGVFRT